MAVQKPSWPAVASSQALADKAGRIMPCQESSAPHLIFEVVLDVQLSAAAIKQHLMLAAGQSCKGAVRGLAALDVSC